jgi:hypothetical protein
MVMSVAGRPAIITRLPCDLTRRRDCCRGPVEILGTIDQHFQYAEAR